MHTKIQHYLKMWERHGYSSGVPDTVLDDLMHERLAPSYRAIALAIIKNDHALQSLGFSPGVSKWYVALKRIEIATRPLQETDQMRLTL